jgi:D-sedoheptulose 7-phosphate isomerase
MALMKPCTHEPFGPPLGLTCPLCVAELPDGSWRKWAIAISAGVCSVPDDALRCVAATVAASRIVLTAGNGGSASLASHAAQAIMKPDYRAGGGRPALCLNDMVPTHTAHANDGGWELALLESARPFLGSGAVLLAISSSGKSPNLVQLANAALQLGIEIITFTGFHGQPLRSLATVSIHVDSQDYEVVEPVHDALLHRVQYHLRELNKK